MFCGTKFERESRVVYLSSLATNILQVAFSVFCLFIKRIWVLYAYRAPYRFPLLRDVCSLFLVLEILTFALKVANAKLNKACPR